MNQSSSNNNFKQILNFADKRPATLQRGEWKFEQAFHPSNIPIQEQSSFVQRQYGSSYVSHWVTPSNTTPITPSTPVTSNQVKSTNTATTCSVTINQAQQYHLENQHGLYKTMFEYLAGKEQVEWIDRKYVERNSNKHKPRMRVTINDILIIEEEIN
jgi:hypothetical protein